jgi:hypothetical protein
MLYSFVASALASVFRSSGDHDAQRRRCAASNGASPLRVGTSGLLGNELFPSNMCLLPALKGLLKFVPITLLSKGRYLDLASDVHARFGALRADHALRAAEATH